MTEYQETVINETEQINLAIAAIAGWTNIEIWNEKATRKTWTGTNLAHPELGRFIPNYVDSLDAIKQVFDHLKLGWTLTSLGCASNGIIGAYASSPAIAMCKLLLEINPEPIKPESEQAQTSIVEATFG